DPRLRANCRKRERCPSDGPGGFPMSTQMTLRESEIFMFDPRAEAMPRPALTELQLNPLKRILDHAYANVAHYRRKFDEAGVKPSHLSALSDLRHFPFTLKSDLRDNYPFGMFATPRTDLVRVHASSGTTGK